MKRVLLALIVLIPLSSVLLGIVMIVLAFSGANDIIAPEEIPLSKTSWQEQST